MTEFYQGRAWIELDITALRHNVERLQALLNPDCALMPAVKANAYGHGAIPIAKELNALGIRAFCVASILEGVELRQNGILGEILILGYTHPQYAPLLAQYRLTQTILDHTYALALNACKQTIDVQIKIDTGMHRLGTSYQNLAELQQIFACRQLRVTGAYTHLYEDDLTLPTGRAAALAQGRAFYQTVDRLKALGYRIPKVHILASSGLLHCPGIGGDYGRVGIALYGQMPVKAQWKSAGVDLRPVLSLKARISLIRDIAKGDGAGYGHQFVARRDTKIAVATIGYGDGLPRRLSNGVGAALIRGQTAPIIGRICMDQTLLDVTDIPAVVPGDIAVFIGKSGSKEITACDVAEQAGTISNEILSCLSHRLERTPVQTTARQHAQLLAAGSSAL